MLNTLLCYQITLRIRDDLPEDVDRKHASSDHQGREPAFLEDKVIYRKNVN